MHLAVLAAWTVSALAGVPLMVRWLADGGARRRVAKVTRFPGMLIVGHPALAVAGLGLWIGFILTQEDRYAWGALAVITTAALLGFAMLTRWLGGGRHARGASRGRPLTAILLHATTGLSTFVLIMLIATTIR
ncbi:hypothetical protein Pth03_29400 [Planotetraspora thailandica]|uniref:Uncharacterized protein n=1 Tax=Planotetraspora thailandica TaxID=487172 RepID=A0A8J3V0S8_9ACTN|nr:hypothetical protein [Planotetraspora thailandica]GII54551.1 hypothetical protein Pth03_29400 [Planotetraspora thailandica]